VSTGDRAPPAARRRAARLREIALVERAAPIGDREHRCRHVVLQALRVVAAGDAEPDGRREHAARRAV
jgi:hypothetical protein